MNYLLKVFLLSMLLVAGCNEPKSMQNDKVNYVKPHAPVDMKFTVSARPQVGANVRYKLMLTTGMDVDDMVVTVSAEASVQLLEFPQMLHLGPQKMHQPQMLTVICQPQANGLAYLNVVVTLVVDGQQQSRSFSIPVNVGDVAARQQLKPTGVIEENAAGDRMISMPAEESLRPAK